MQVFSQCIIMMVMGVCCVADCLVSWISVSRICDDLSVQAVFVSFLDLCVVLFVPCHREMTFCDTSVFTSD